MLGGEGGGPRLHQGTVHAFGFGGRPVFHQLDDVVRLAAVFPDAVDEGSAREREFLASRIEGGGEIGTVAGGAVGVVDGFAAGDDGGVFGPFTDERGVIERGEGLLRFFFFGIIHGSDGGTGALFVGLIDAALVVENPIDEKPDDGGVEGEEPPVRQFLVEFLDTVVFVFAEDDFTFALGEVAAFDFLIAIGHDRDGLEGGRWFFFFGGLEGEHGEVIVLFASHEHGAEDHDAEDGEHEEDEGADAER